MFICSKSGIIMNKRPGCYSMPYGDLLGGAKTGKPDHYETLFADLFRGGVCVHALLPVISFSFQHGPTTLDGLTILLLGQSLVGMMTKREQIWIER